MWPVIKYVLRDHMGKKNMAVYGSFGLKKKVVLKSKILHKEASTAHTNCVD